MTPDNPNRSDRSPRSLRPSGGYHDLRRFQTATLIYDGTVCFCDRWVPKSPRCSATPC